MRSAKSESIKSVRSFKSFKMDNLPTTPTPDIESSLPAACQKYNCSYTVLVKKEYHQDDLIKKRRMSEAPVKYKKIAIAPTIPTLGSVRIDSFRRVLSRAAIINSELSDDGESVLRATAVYDQMHHFVELVLRKIKCIPRTLMQIIRILLPYYEYLTKLTFFQCTIDGYVIHEINNIFSIKCITDINFDGSKFNRSDVSLLLANKSASIKYLSLSGCQINDQACGEIASKLYFPEHAEKNLLILNLSSNHITDEGANYLGEALRTNRHLRYLNLADNRIGDDGAISIVNSLTEFLLTSDEISNKKIRYLDHLKAKRQLFFRMFFEYSKSKKEPKSKQDLHAPSRKSELKKKKSSATSIKSKSSIKKEANKDASLNASREDLRLQKIAAELIGPFVDPFSPHNLKTRNDLLYCLGNFTLSYLNLSFNNLSYLSVKKIASVMQYQKTTKLTNQSGHIRIVIEGNNLPTTCSEYQIINDIVRLAKGGFPFGGDPSGRRKSRARMSLAPQLTGRN